MTATDASKGGKWTDYAKAISIVVATVLSVITYFKSCKTDDNLSLQKDQINTISNRVDSLDKILNKQARFVAGSLTFKNLKKGDTLGTPVFNVKGNIDQRPSSDFKLYGMIKVTDQYNTMATPINIEANGDWESTFISYKGAGAVTICLVICNNESSTKLKDQINAGNYKVPELYSGMQIVGSLNVYVK